MSHSRYLKIENKDPHTSSMEDDSFCALQYSKQHQYTLRIYIRICLWNAANMIYDSV